VVRSHRLNPLPHAGTISVFLLAVVVVSGVYITLFFQYGFEASYRSMQRIDEHPIQSTVRTIHRYSSAGLVLTTLVHSWRIFVAGRFRGPRRWRWTTGVTSLVIVWLAGVTGYWLVWDRRAQALNEATESVFGGVGGVSTFMVRNIYGPDVGTGWVVVFLIWLAHLLLTAVIGYFLWRHVRRTRLRILPPRHWMAIMFGALVVVSLSFPAELLERADPSRLAGDLPLDPFVLFLLPPLLSNWAWVAVLVFVALIVVALVGPHVWRADPPVVVIDEQACTGCDLCVIDCPYQALAMVDRSDADERDGTQARRPVAVVDADACVGCGICIGSCSFGAMALPGFESPETLDPQGRHVVIAWSRHLQSAQFDRLPGETGEQVAIVEVPCSGMVHADTIGALTRAGASAVQVVGCPPGDCAFGLGNTTLAERLAGTRAPHVSRKWVGAADEDWVAPGDLIDAVAHPNQHPSADATRLVSGRRVVGSVAVVLVSIVAVALATRAPYAGSVDGAAVRVVVDHTPGLQLEGQAAATGRRGDDVEVIVMADGEEIARTTVAKSGATAIGLVDVDLAPGESDLEVTLIESTGATVLFDGPVDLDAGRRLVLNAVDVPPPPRIKDGRDVFGDRTLGGCGVCHSTRPGDDGVGPSLAGVATRAAERVEGLDAAGYLEQSILDPDAFIVDGYRAGQMFPDYGERLSEQQIASLLEYLLTLNDGVDP
jgi:ferredoxin/mono/diheme cytochrome c family protein